MIVARPFGQVLQRDDRWQRTGHRRGLRCRGRSFGLAAALPAVLLPAAATAFGLPTAVRAGILRPVGVAFLVALI
jgi:hypothetical protein